jgi:hypothetical protein
MATQKGSGLISRAVREALSTLVSPQLCEQLISRSLASQGLSAVPESGTEIGEWLEGSLRGEVETLVGPDAADLMMMQLGPIAAYAAISMPSLPLSMPTVSNVNADSSAPSTPASRRSSDNDLDDDRPTDLRFDLTAEPVWAPASGPPDKSKPRSDPFRSDPPTGVFAAPRADGSPIASFLAGGGKRPSEDNDVRTLAPPRPTSDVAPAPARGPAGAISTNTAKNRTARPSPLDEVSNESGKALPLVLTATNNREALNALRRYLTNAASVVHVPDLVGLLDALEEPDVVEPVVLIDCHNPTVHISSVSAIGEDLPRGTTVVLWGVDEATWQQLDRERAPACRWVRCSSEATTDDVGSLCSMLLG